MAASIQLSDLIKHLGGTLKGEDKKINALSSLQLAKPGDLSFLSNPKLRELLNYTAASALIVPQDFPYQSYPNKSFILTFDPYLYYARAARLFYPTSCATGEHHFSAVISPQAQIAQEVDIGPQVVVEPGVVIGKKSRIMAGAVLESGVKLGDNCLIHPNVSLLHGVELGDRVEVHSGTVIGSDGFGLAWNGQSWEKIPQIGKVIIGNDVEIGANVTIDRGAIGDTVIHEGVKIDNLVQIAHNCEIGEHTAIAAMVGMAGSTKIGKRCKIAGAVKFVGHLEVADDCIIAGDAIVSHSLKQAGHYAGNFPIQTYQEWQHNAVVLKRLKKMYNTLRRLAARLDQES
jgi:UDP-3-O-[3-hydroxymyristoyl] glucosamine N-acyltransferase